MQLTKDQGSASYQIRAYEPGLIRINETNYGCSLIIAPESLIDNWTPQTLAELSAEHLAPIIALKPEIVLLGTGKQFLMPSAERLAPLYDAQLGVESMDTGAACRTYTALMAEGRLVVAALLIR